MNRIVRSALFAAAILVAAPSFAQDDSAGGLTLAPLVMRTNGSIGGKRTIEFYTANPLTRQVSATIDLFSSSFADWTYALLPNKPNPRDATSWFQSPPSQISLKPGEDTRFQLSYTVPRTVQPGTYWTMMRFSPKPDGQLRVQYLVPIIITVGRRLTAKPSLGSPQLDMSGQSGNVLIPLTNDSPGYSVIGAQGEIRDLRTNRVVARPMVEDINLFPNTKRNLVMPAGQIPDGKYRLSFRVEVDGRRLPAQTADVEVKSSKVASSGNRELVSVVPISLDPPAFSQTLTAGATRVQVLRVVNLSNKPITLDLAATGVEQASNGSFGTNSGSTPPGLTVSVSPQNLTIQPNGQGVVRVQCSVTKEATGDLWFAVTLAERGNAKSIAEQVMGTITVANTRSPKVELELDQLESVKGKPVGVKFHIKNVGNSSVGVIPMASVLESGFSNVANLDVRQVGFGGILPGAVLDNAIALPQNLKPGKYVLEINYQYGPKDMATLRVPFEVPKPIGKS